MGAPEGLYALFETPVGRCALSWGPGGLLAVTLPEGDDEATIRNLLRRRARTAAPGDVPDVIEAAIRRIVLMMEGSGDLLDNLELDRSGVPDFDLAVYERIHRVGPGATITYGEIARDLGDVALSRRVGQALGRNPWPIVVPCHRVLGAKGQSGGFSAPGGVDTKMKLLSIEAERSGGSGGLFGALPFVRKR